MQSVIVADTPLLSSLYRTLATAAFFVGCLVAKGSVYMAGRTEAAV
jgi:hypothetical protein